ncbi:hypothetical protein MTP99_011659 [Tenebrio molitor]|nr:hypothetical protein MTP99_011659 [Tenebrio molitor]
MVPGGQHRRRAVPFGSTDATWNAGPIRGEAVTYPTRNFPFAGNITPQRFSPNPTPKRRTVALPSNIFYKNFFTLIAQVRTRLETSWKLMR